MQGETVLRVFFLKKSILRYSDLISISFSGFKLFQALLFEAFVLRTRFCKRHRKKQALSQAWNSCDGTLYFKGFSLICHQKLKLSQSKYCTMEN